MVHYSMGPEVQQVCPPSSRPAAGSGSINPDDLRNARLDRNKICSCTYLKCLPVVVVMSNVMDTLDWGPGEAELLAEDPDGPPSLKVLDSTVMDNCIGLMVRLIQHLEITNS